MLNSWQIPMMFLVTAWLYDVLIPAVKGRVFGIPAAHWLPAALLLVVIPTNLYLLAWRFYDLSRYTYPYYMEQDYITTFDWLRENTDPKEVVLSALDSGQYIPGLSGNKAFLAHWANTVNYYDKVERVNGFYSVDAPTTARLDTLRQFGVDYILVGPAERALGTFNPATMLGVELVFETPLVKVYLVDEENLVNPEVLCPPFRCQLPDNTLVR